MTPAPYVEYRRISDEDSEMRVSGESNRMLADKFGVGIIAIRRARSGETWKHVSGSHTMGA